MDTSLDTLKNNAYTSGANASKLAADTPGMLSQLKQNLVGIFAKDNPIIGARDTALSDYLSTAGNTRASLLPSTLGNVPGIDGRTMTLSPTQQDAIVGARNAAALAPLAGYNEILKGMFGNIGDVVQGAAGIYSAQQQAAQQDAANALNLYKAAIDEYQATKPAAGGNEGIDLNSILSLISGQLGVGSGTDANYDGILDSIYGGSAIPTQQSQPQPSLGGGVYQPNVQTGSATLAAPKPAKTSKPTTLIPLPTNFNPSAGVYGPALKFPGLGLSL